MSPLFAELHRWAATPHVWGLDDCMTSVCAWIEAQTGVDPMGEFRAAYDGPVSCERVTGFLSDPVAVCARQFEGLAGLSRTDVPAPGDVAVIVLGADARWPHGALWLGDCWAVKGEGGATTVHPALVHPLAIWSVGYEK